MHVGTSRAYAAAWCTHAWRCMVHRVHAPKAFGVRTGGVGACFAYACGVTACWIAGVLILCGLVVLQ